MEELEKPEVKEEQTDIELDQPVVEDEKKPSEETEILNQEQIAVVFGEDETPKPEEDSAVIRALRKQNRDLNKKVKELAKQTEKTPELGPKPTLESCDMDDKQFEEKLIKWHEDSKKHESQKAKEQEENERQQQEWAKRVDNYQKRKLEFSSRVNDYEDKESVVEEVLNPTQIGIILDVCDKSDEMIYALGTNTKKLQELAKISNPVRFSSAIGKLEDKMKTISRKPSTQPEETIKGDKPMSSQVDKRLEQLRSEVSAGKEGALSKLIAYKRQMKKSG